jgi:putative ubiquitin-RnfH superfamily antitoxin RatB of RatAB toxin-antitoxin module
MNAPTIPVEVVYALPKNPARKELQLPADSTVGAAIRASGLLAEYPEIDLERNRVGIFGRLVRPETILRSGDRVEIYRPLLADPKEVRRRRAAAAKKPV